MERSASIARLGSRPLDIRTGSVPSMELESIVAATRSALERSGPATSGALAIRLDAERLAR